MNDKEFLDFKAEVLKLHDITDKEEYAKQLAHLFLGNWLSLQTILLMAIDFGQQHPHWIPVEERLPGPHFADTSSDWVLVCTTKGGIFIDSYNHKHNEWCNNRTSVAHWMPIVPPRKEE